MVSRPGSVSLLVGAPDSRRAAWRIAVLIVWAWVVAACGLGVCTAILFSLSSPWFGTLSLLLGIGALLRALVLRRKISAARLESIRPMPDMSSVAADSRIDAEADPPILAGMPAPPLPSLSAPSPVISATLDSPRISSLSEKPPADVSAGSDEYVDRISADAWFTEHELPELGLDRGELAAHRSPTDEGGSGLGLWLGVGIVVLVGLLVIRGRSARTKRAEVGSDSAPAVLPVRDAPRIPRSSRGDGTDSGLTGAPEKAPVVSVTLSLDLSVPPTAASAALQPPRRLGRFTPPPALARFAVVPLLTSFVLAYLAIRTAGDKAMSAAIPIAIVSFVTLGLAFYLAPAS